MLFANAMVSRNDGTVSIDPGPERIHEPAIPTPRLRDIVVTMVVNMVSLALIAWILPGIRVDTWWAALLAVAVASLANGLFWPIVIRFASTLLVWTAGLLGLVLNGLFLLFAAAVVPGFEVDGFWSAVLAVFGMTAIGAIAGSLLATDDDAVWRRRTVRRMVQRIHDPERTDVPGVLFLQIDGLSETVLRRALGEGYLPTLARWVRTGSHRIVGWQCDLSSQTGASQAGILHGNNEDMPAFRWYDKTAGKVFVSNRPQDAAEIERRQSDGDGLLVDGGVSRTNVFSGDSGDSLFTFSTITDRERTPRNGLAYFLADPYAVPRVIILSIADLGREFAANWRAKRRGIEPHGHRGGVYPLLRVVTTVVLRDLTVNTLLADIYRGVPAAYVDFVGYDEVAHHSGISAPDAMETLWRLDQQFARLERAITEAPRPYHVVVLSDHGQTQGATFEQRYGQTLAEFVESLVEGDADVDAPEFSTEGWGNLNGVLTDTVEHDDTRMAKFIKAVVKRRTVDGEVVLGPGYDTASGASDGADDREHDVIVLASGNLGLVSFPAIEGRATLEMLAVEHPRLVQHLAEHPGIGFVLVASDELGPVVLGGNGLRRLDDGHVEGEDPLADFAPSTASHLLRTHGFSNAPDLLVNSFYDPDIDEAAAFEDQIGFHGGLGGKQSEPFLLFPSAFPVPDEPLVGAASVHHVFKGWLREIATNEPAAAESTA